MFWSKAICSKTFMEKLMNKKIKLLVFLIFVGSIMCACAAKKGSTQTGESSTGTDNAIAVSSATATVSKESAFEPFYVYEDFKSNKNHYSPSGWMGDIASLKLFPDCEQEAYEGTYCIKLEYKPSDVKQWVGVYWQHPANNWGDKKGGYNLTGAKQLSFWAKGAEGKEVLSEVKIGGISGVYSDSDVAWLKGIKLSRTWKKYTINLSKSDLSSISGGFCVVLSKKDNPAGCIIYLDEIKYE